MKSKVWALKFYGHTAGSGYFQAADMKFYDMSSTLISTSGARVWVRDPYTTANASNAGTSALFDGDNTTWIAMPDYADGNLMLITFPSEVDVGSFSVTTRVGSITKGLIKLYKVVSTPDYFYDIWDTQEDLIFVNNFVINSSATQATYTYNLSTSPFMSTWVAKSPKKFATTAVSATVDKNRVAPLPAYSVQQVYRRDSYVGDGFISGIVTGATGSAVANAKLQLVETIRRNFVAETISDSLGAYSFNNLIRNGTLFDVIADEGSGDYEKLVSSRRMPKNMVEHSLVCEGKRTATTTVAYLNNKPLITPTAYKRKGTGGLALLNRKDPFYDKTVLLVDVDATTITDKSKLALPFTQGTLTIASTNSPPIGTYSIQLAATTNGFFSGLDDLFDRDLTVEYYARVASVTAASRLLTIGASNFTGTAYGSIACTLDTARLNTFDVGNINAYVHPWLETGNNLTVNTWQHVAWVKQGDVYTLYRDGVQISSQTYRTYPFDIRTATKVVNIGTSTTNFSVQLAGLRITTAARYTTGFTPPTASELYG
jgi:hypothetical protein